MERKAGQISDGDSRRENLTAMSKALVIEHADSCPIAHVGHWLEEAGHTLQVVRGHREPIPSSLAGIDALVVMGGPMNAYQDVDHPWFAPTRELLRQAVEADLPTLAICLGHQLLTVATGGTVARSPGGQRTGLESIDLTADGAADPIMGRIPHDAVAVHWNGDVVVDPPPAATVLSNSRGEVQTFRLGQRVYGVQFHPEVDVEIVRNWAANDIASGDLDQARVESALADIAAAADRLTSTWRPFTRAIFA